MRGGFDPGLGLLKRRGDRFLDLRETFSGFLPLRSSSASSASSSSVAELLEPSLSEGPIRSVVRIEATDWARDCHRDERAISVEPERSEALEVLRPRGRW